MRKIICALVLVFAVCALACADEAASGDVNVGYLLQRDIGNAAGFRTADGLQAVWLGTFRNKQPEVNPKSPDVKVKPDEGLFTVFMVKSDKETPLKLDVREGLDCRTNKFSYRGGDWGYISDDKVNSSTKSIPAGFWVRVTFWHNLPFKYGDRPLIARLGFVINGHEITLKRFRPKVWNDWVYVEREYVRPLEEDSRRIEFEELEVRPVKR